jgi:hypothetical protein
LDQEAAQIGGALLKFVHARDHNRRFHCRQRQYQQLVT